MNRGSIKAYQLFSSVMFYTPHAPFTCLMHLNRSREGGCLCRALGLRCLNKRGLVCLCVGAGPPEAVPSCGEAEQWRADRGREEAEEDSSQAGC